MDVPTSSTATQRLVNRRRRTLRLVVLFGVFALTPLIAVTMGSATVALDDVVGVVLSHLGLAREVTWPHSIDAIVWENRVPRVLAGLTVGAILGVSGVILQALVRNPLAEPYVLGVSSGASTGAASAIILIGAVHSLTTGLFAFVGALLATFALLVIAGKGAGPLQLILAGLAVGFGFQSLTNFLLFSSGSPETSQSVMFWMLGSLARTQWSQLPLLAVVAIVLTAAACLLGPVLDALASGDRTAESVGVHPGRARVAFLIPVSAAVAVAVSAAGGIGFVGLIIPHLVRNLIGYSHRLLVLGSALAAALFLTWTDAIARVIFTPVELPIGVITGLIGAPFLVLLIRRQRAIQ